MGKLELMLLRPVIERALTVSAADVKAIATKTGLQEADIRKVANAFRDMVLKKLGF